MPEDQTLRSSKTTCHLPTSNAFLLFLDYQAEQARRNSESRHLTTSEPLHRLSIQDTLYPTFPTVPHPPREEHYLDENLPRMSVTNTMAFDSDAFSIQNIPYGVTAATSTSPPTIVTRFHDHVYFIPHMIEAGVLPGLSDEIKRSLASVGRPLRSSCPPFFWC